MIQAPKPMLAITDVMEFEQLAPGVNWPVCTHCHRAVPELHVKRLTLPPQFHQGVDPKSGVFLWVAVCHGYRTVYTVDARNPQDVRASKTQELPHDGALEFGTQVTYDHARQAAGLLPKS